MMLDSSRLHMAETLFERLVKLPATARGPALDQACGPDHEMREYLERLLQHDDSGMGGFLGALSNGRWSGLGDDGQAVLPTSIGGYRVLGRLGEGGMGVVYEGEQPHTQRRVALKTIRDLTMNDRALRRFYFEAEVLARLRHPGIALIYEFDVGEIRYQDMPPRRVPFFAMELVEGEPLCEYAEKRRLQMRERLEMLLRVCEAVHHAHQKGVIHRDLKPGNILVDQTEQPRVLDFGVARVFDDSSDGQTARTALGQWLGTVAYMSPEQLSGDAHAVDTRSDVYSLGVVGYELLTGTQHIDITGLPLPQAVRTLAEVEPKPAGQLRPALRGDVEAILCKALARDPARRYASAAEFGGDIRRYLDHEPVIARTPGALYQFAKYARRNRGLVSAFGLAALALITGTIGTATFAWRAKQQAIRAEEQTSRAQATVRLLRQMLSSVDPRAALGRDVTVREMLDEGARRLQAGELTDHAEVRAALQSTIGETYSQLGRYADARPHLEAALETFRSLHGRDHPDVIGNLSILAGVLSELGEFEEAERLDREALAAAQSLYGPRHRQVAYTLSDLGLVLSSNEKLIEAEECYRRALEMRRTLPDVPPDELAAGLNNLGSILQQVGRVNEAEPLLREALVIRRAELHPDHPNLLSVLNNLGSLLRKQEKFDEAEGLLAEVVAVQRRTLTSIHPDRAIGLNNLAGLLSVRNRNDEAIPLYREAIEVQQAMPGVNNPALGKTVMNLASALRAAGEQESAEREMRRAIELLRQSFGEDDPNVAAAMHNLAIFYRELGDLESAERMMREVLVIFERRLPKGHPSVAHCRDSLGAILSLRERFQEAVPQLELALEERRAALGENHTHVALSLTKLSEARLRLGDAAPAAHEASAAVDILRKSDAASPDLGVALLTLAESQLAQAGLDDLSALESLIQESRTIRSAAFGETSWQVADADRVKGLCLIQYDRFTEAELLLTGAFERLKGEDTQQQFQRIQARQRTIRALSKLYTAWGNPQKAATWQSLTQGTDSESTP